MITIIGTGHVFDLGRAMLFLVKNIWPDAVLVELDVRRYRMLEASLNEENQEQNAKPEKDSRPWIYRRSADYQQKMAKEQGTNVGNELLVAVNTGKLLGAEIGFIDDDAEKVMAEMWNEMPFSEKARYTMSTYRDRIVGKKGVEEVVDDFATREKEMMDDMRRRYPTLVRKLIDERNVHMAEQIKEYTTRFHNIVVVCGDAHVEGLASLLADTTEIRKIRLNDLKDERRLREVFSEAWNHEVIE